MSRTKRHSHRGRGKQKPIVAPICPYCGKTAKCVDSSVIYHGRSYGPAWVCEDYPRCDAYCGCHPNTTRPLGTLANAELRKARNRTHDHVDAFWKAGTWGRSDTYRWLAKAMGIEIGECHIAMFDLARCDLAVAVCVPMLDACGYRPLFRKRQ